MRNTRSLLAAAILAITIAGTLTGCAKGLKEGSMAPDFTLKDSFGRDVRLAQYRGNVVLLSFWAVDCTYCRVEAPHLRELQKAYKGKGFQVVAVNAWDEPRAKVNDYAIKNGLNYTILLDGQATARNYRIDGLPSGYLIDREGKILHFHEGWEPGDEKKLAGWVETALK